MCLSQEDLSKRKSQLPLCVVQLSLTPPHSLTCWRPGTPHPAPDVPQRFGAGT